MRHQPIPAWRRRQNDQDAARDAAFQQNVVGPMMGLDADHNLDDSATYRPERAILYDGTPGSGSASSFDDVTRPALGPGGEHHTIGRDFITAGRAVFTIAGKSNRYTFKVDRKDPEPGSRYLQPTFFVSLRTGGEEHAYSYVGILNPNDGSIRFTKGSKIQSNAPAAIALQWTFARVWAGKELPAPGAIYHEGRCGRCGRPLTVPESILTGFGPDCADILGIRIPTE